MVDENSKKAYKEIINNGYVSKKQRIVLECIIEKPNISDYEIADRIDEKINSITPRRNELEQLGLIENSGIIFRNSRPSNCFSVVKTIDLLEFHKKKELFFAISKSRKNKKNYIHYKDVEDGCCKFLREVEKLDSDLFEEYVKSDSKNWKSWLLKKIFNENVFKK